MGLNSGIRQDEEVLKLSSSRVIAQLPSAMHKRLVEIPPRFYKLARSIEAA